MALKRTGLLRASLKNIVFKRARASVKKGGATYMGQKNSRPSVLTNPSHFMKVLRIPYWQPSRSWLIPGYCSVHIQRYGIWYHSQKNCLVVVRRPSLQSHLVGIPFLGTKHYGYKFEAVLIDIKKKFFSLEKWNASAVILDLQASLKFQGLLNVYKPSWLPFKLSSREKKTDEISLGYSYKESNSPTNSRIPSDPTPCIGVGRFHRLVAASHHILRSDRQ